MKFIYTSLLALAACVTAQNIAIASPQAGSVVTLGGAPLVVEVAKPNSLSGSTDVSIVIGLQICGATACQTDDTEPILGNILYAGNFAPVQHEPSRPPYQNFTFNLAHLNSGNARLHVTHFVLIGAGPEPLLETKSVDILVRGASGR